MDQRYFKLKEFTDEALANCELVAMRLVNHGTLLACHGYKNGNNVNYRFFYEGDAIDYSEAIKLLDR